jgi:hypothetical protein
MPLSSDRDYTGKVGYLSEIDYYSSKEYKKSTSRISRRLWLEKEENDRSIRSIKGIGDKTLDCFRLRAPSLLLRVDSLLSDAVL